MRHTAYECGNTYLQINLDGARYRWPGSYVPTSNISVRIPGKTSKKGQILLQGARNHRITYFRGSVEKFGVRNILRRIRNIFYLKRQEKFCWQWRVISVECTSYARRTDDSLISSITAETKTKNTRCVHFEIGFHSWCACFYRAAQNSDTIWWNFHPLPVALWYPIRNLNEITLIRVIRAGKICSAILRLWCKCEKRANGGPRFSRNRRKSLGFDHR